MLNNIAYGMGTLCLPHAARGRFVCHIVSIRQGDALFAT